MNGLDSWTKKSIDFANSKGYLDRLHSIYSADSSERKIPAALMSEIKEAYDKKDKLMLLKSISKLAKTEKSPIEDSYMGILKLNDCLIDANPKTMDRIAGMLLGLSWEELVKRCNQPKKASRKLGNSFKAWVKTLGYPSLKLEEFNSFKGTALLDASDSVMQDFAEKQLKCKLKEKGDIDLIAKLKNGKYVVGGAKFITSGGGAQDNQFFNILDFAEGSSGNAIRIAIVDGVVWFKESGRIHTKICGSNGISISALMLVDFIKEAEK
jgi:hypothetical protein